MHEQAGIMLKGLYVDKLRAEYQALETQKKELTATYKNCEKEVRDLKRKQEILNQYLGRTQTDPVQEQFKKKNNPILIGPAGVGKTAIVEGIANLMVSDKCPSFLKDKKIISLNIF